MLVGGTAVYCLGAFKIDAASVAGSKCRGGGLNHDIMRRAAVMVKVDLPQYCSIACMTACIL